MRHTTVPAERLRVQPPNEVWAIELQFDQTAEGPDSQLLHVLDEPARGGRDLYHAGFVAGGDSFTLQSRPH